MMTRLRWLRRAARLVLGWEILLPAIWPGLALIGTYICLSLLNLPQSLPGWPRLAIFVLFMTAAVSWTAFRVLRLRWPDQAARDRRLERDSGLAHQPLAVLTDQPAMGDLVAKRLWMVHQARAEAAIAALRIRLPHPDMATVDRFGLRGALIVLLAACLIAAGRDAGPRLRSGFWPELPAWHVFAPVQVQAWFTPPAYTGQPPIFLPAGGGSATVPTGSVLTVNMSGGQLKPRLSLDGQSVPFQALDKTSWQATATVRADGQLTLRRWLFPMTGWALTVMPDHAPRIQWASPPSVADTQSGAVVLRLPWLAVDDYGVTGVQAVFHLRDRPEAPALTVDLPISTPGRAAHGVGMPDLVAHPWAGLPVTVQLRARDGAGQTDTSTIANLTLPERAFRNPVAQALIALRKQLTLHPDNRAAAREQLVNIATATELYGDDKGIFLNLSSLISLLLHDHDSDAIADAQARMWGIAIELEDGATRRSAQALAEAQKRAHDALQSTPMELQQRIAELESAIAQHVQNLLNQAQDRNADKIPDPNATTITGQQLESLAQQAEEAAQRGDMQTAAQKLAELQRLAQMLQNAKAVPRSQVRDAARQRAQQQIGALQDVLRQQSQLLDHTRQRANNDQPDDMGTAPPPPASREDDATAQAALHQKLNGLMRDFKTQNGQSPAPLGDAAQAMQRAASALSNGDDREAAAAQQRAIEAMQQGARGMQDELAQRLGRAPGQQPGSEGADGDQPGGEAHQREDQRDPMGRQVQEGTSGTEYDQKGLPAGVDRPARSRAILQELRRRDADRTRPQPERNYIERLIKPF